MVGSPRPAPPARGGLRAAARSPTLSPFEWALDREQQEGALAAEAGRTRGMPVTAVPPAPVHVWGRSSCPGVPGGRRAGHRQVGCSQACPKTSTCPASLWSVGRCPDRAEPLQEWVTGWRDARRLVAAPHRRRTLDSVGDAGYWSSGGVSPVVTEADSRAPFPERSALDHADSAARALVSVIPGVGGPTAKLLDIVIAPPLEQRRRDWFRGLADRLDRLERKVERISVESLRDEEAFITAVTTASTIAIRNHDEEKLAALQNAVVNVALRTEPDVEIQAVFLSLVDYLTPLHMQLLRFFEHPRAFVERSRRDTAGARTTREIALRVLPDLPAEAYDLLCRDLENRGLVQLPTEPTIGLTDERPTELGDRFLRFISREHAGDARRS